MAFSVPKQPANPQVRSVRAKPGVVHNIRVNVNLIMNAPHPVFTDVFHLSKSDDEGDAARRVELGIDDPEMMRVHIANMLGHHSPNELIVETWGKRAKHDSAMDINRPSIHLTTFQSYGMLPMFSKPVTIHNGSELKPWGDKPLTHYIDIEGVRYICPPSGRESGLSIRSAAMAHGGGPGTICCLVGDHMHRPTKLKPRSSGMINVATFVPFTVMSVALDTFTAEDIPERFGQAREIVAAARPWHRAAVMILTHDMKLIEV